MKLAYVLTNGCPENRIDGSRMRKCLELNGWGTAATPREADLILFNACGLVDVTETLSLRIYRELERSKKAGARLVVCGCLPRINPAALAGEYDDVTFGSDDMEALGRLIRAEPGTLDCRANDLLPYTDAPKPQLLERLRSTHLSLHPYALKTRKFQTEYEFMFKRVNITGHGGFFIKVATGCLNECAYCAVKLSRGTVRSKPIAEILREQETGLSRGHSELNLIGTDLGSYGRDLGVTLVDLLREMTGVAGAFKIKLRNVNARFLKLMAPELARVLADGKVVYMSSAVQSGSDRILNLMNRGYTAEEYRQAVATVRNGYPDLQLRTQIIVGFPGETEGDFEQTLRLVDEVDFDFVEVRMFSARAGTRAFELPGRVSRGTMLRRYYRMLKTVVEKCGRKIDLPN